MSGAGSATFCTKKRGYAKGRRRFVSFDESMLQAFNALFESIEK